MGSRTRPTRTRPIRLILSGLLVIPVISLVALWGFAASVTVGDEFAKRNYDTLNKTFANAGESLIANLARERALSFAWLSSGGRMPRTALDAQRNSTDAAIPVFRRQALSGPATSALDTAAKNDLAALLAQVARLPRIRSAIDAQAMSALDAFQAYDSVADAHFRFFTDMATLNDISIYRQGETNLDGARTAEMVGREAALLGGVTAAGGHMSQAERVMFAQTVGSQRYLEASLLRQPNPALRAPYARLLGSPAYASFKAIEDQIVGETGNSGLRTVDPRVFQANAQAVATSLTQSVLAGGAVVAAEAKRLGNQILLRLALAGGAGLVGVIASIFGLLWFGRSISRELGSLQAGVSRLADERLPWVVDRLRRGEDIDIPAEVSATTLGDTSRTTEVAQVADAFSKVQLTAIEAAVGQARLRKGVNHVFLNLARRNQSLLHKQLDMLDSMERSAADPDALAGYFRLDHLTTRMRRHAEGLIILAGEVPGRGWRSPVNVLDVLRGAVAEVEDYVRVDVISQSQAALVGTVIADVIHLLAELIENATAFSPPNTRVTVTADRVGNGFVVEIEDRGLGINPDELKEINHRLAHPPEFDLADSDRLGLFIVGQLAARHQIKVTLRESPFGGTTAIVLMPHAVVAPEGPIDGQPGAGDNAAAVRPAGAHGEVGTDSGTNPAGPAPMRLVPAADRRQATQSGAYAGPGTRQAGEAHITAGTHLGLPRRTPQANLVPQLRDGPATGPGGTTSAAADGEDGPP